MTFESIENRIREISDIIGLTSDEVDRLLSHEKISKSEIEVNGKKYPAYRILHSSALGPGKGGIRFHENVDEDEVKSLSFWMSLKTSLMGLPLGGAKGGVKINPKELSDEEIEEVAREYIRIFYNVLGQDKDIPAPDVNTNEKIMSIMLDEYEKIKNKKEPAMITGKPVSLGGLEQRKDSTSKGGFIVLKELLSLKDVKCEDAKVAIQGFGNAGMNIAKILFDEGFKIVVVSDSKGGLYDQEGLDVLKLIKIKKETGRLSEEDWEIIPNKELLELDVDILVLAALENQITNENVEDIKTKYILELANGPIDYEADKILFEKNIIVIPDILANSGGVVMSYFEWLKGKGEEFDNKFLKEEFEKIMKTTFEKVDRLSSEKNLDLRTASYILAIERILDK